VDSIFGREGIGYRRWGRTKPRLRRYIQEQEKEDQRLDQMGLMRFERLTITTNPL